MKERAYDNIQGIIGKLPFPQYVFTKKEKPGVFAGNEFAALVEKVFSAYAFQREIRFTNSHYSSRDPENYLKYLDKFTEKEKCIAFIVLFNKLIDAENPLHKLNNDFVKLMRSVFKISEAKFSSINRFFKNILPYQDKSDCVYFSGTKENKLIMAGGLNVIFSLKGQNETIYVKYIESLDFFLVKSFQKNNIYNSMQCETTVTNMKLYAGEKLEIGKEYYGHNEMLQLLTENPVFKTIRIEQKEFSPDILLSAEENKIVISGRSTPLSPSNYLEPVLEWLNLYKKYGGRKLNVHLSLEYYNTYTYKFLLRLLSACKNLEKNGKKVNITWYYSPDDDEMIESGEQMKHFYSGNFHCMSINDRISILV